MLKAKMKAIALSRFGAAALSFLVASGLLTMGLQGVTNAYASYTKIKTEITGYKQEVDDLKKDIKDAKIPERMASLEANMEGQKDATKDLKKSVDNLTQVIIQGRYGTAKADH